MARLCERPECSGEATVVYRFDAATRQVWLDSPGDDLRSAGVLCSRHADSLLVPLGWTLEDRRDVVPRLFVLPPRPSHATAGRSGARSSALVAAAGGTHDEEGEQLTIDDASTVADITDREHRDPDTPRAMPWSPGDPAGDPGDTLEPRGELLARAFRGTERKRR
jgi:hypothetical protein